MNRYRIVGKDKFIVHRIIPVYFERYGCVCVRDNLIFQSFLLPTFLRGYRGCIHVRRVNIHANLDSCMSVCLSVLLDMVIFSVKLPSFLEDL